MPTSPTSPTSLEITHAGEAPDHDFTRAVQAALDRLGAAAAGGTLTLAGGTFLVGTLQLHSHTTLHLASGTILLASPATAAFHIRTISVAERSALAMLYARGAADVRVTGPGEIRGNAAHYFAAAPDALGYRAPHAHVQRPRLVVFEGCRRVVLEDLVLRDAPMWTVHLVACADVTVRRVTIDNPLDLPNTDALDIDSCQNVAVEHCFLSAADDAVCIKTTSKTVPAFAGMLRETRNVSIAHCVLRSRSCALKVGTETFYDIEDVHASDITIFETNRAIGLLSRDGGTFRRLAFDRIKIETQFAPAVHWGKADPVHVSVRARVDSTAPGPIEDLAFTNIEILARGAIHLYAEQLHLLRRVTIKAVKIVQEDDPRSEERGLYDIRPPVNPQNPAGTGLDNAYCLNPHTGLPFGVGRYTGGLPVLYADGVSREQLALEDVQIVRPQPLPEGWNPEEIVFV